MDVRFMFLDVFFYAFPYRLASLPPGLPAAWPSCRLVSLPPGLRRLASLPPRALASEAHPLQSTGIDGAAGHGSTRHVQNFIMLP